jgi:hypothetical protein
VTKSVVFVVVVVVREYEMRCYTAVFVVETYMRKKSY